MKYKVKEMDVFDLNILNRKSTMKVAIAFEKGVQKQDREQCLKKMRTVMQNLQRSRSSSAVRHPQDNDSNQQNWRSKRAYLVTESKPNKQPRTFLQYHQTKRHKQDNEHRVRDSRDSASSTASKQFYNFCESIDQKLDRVTGKLDSMNLKMREMEQRMRGPDDGRTSRFQEDDSVYINHTGHSFERRFKKLEHRYENVKQITCSPSRETIDSAHGISLGWLD